MLARSSRRNEAKAIPIGPAIDHAGVGLILLHLPAGPRRSLLPITLQLVLPSCQVGFGKPAPQFRQDFGGGPQFGQEQANPAGYFGRLNLLQRSVGGAVPDFAKGEIAHRRGMKYGVRSLCAQLAHSPASTASDDQMKAAQAKLTPYAQAMSTYLHCLSDEIKSGKDEYDQVSAEWKTQSDNFRNTPAKAQ